MAFSDRYDLLKVVGHPGSYGQVHGVVCNQTKQEYVVKIMKKPRSQISKRDRIRSTLINNEIRIAQTIAHPHIVYFHEVIETNESVHIVMEKCLGGDLFDRIMQYKGKLPEHVAAPIFHDLLQAVLHLHNQDIVHGDIKLSNIMFADSSDHSLRLIDFGMSQWCPNPESSPLKEMVGTPNYQSPEVISGSYTTNADCWSLGVVLFVMIFGFNPFDPFGLTDAVDTVHSRVIGGFHPITQTGYGAFFPIDIPASKSVKDLISQLLTSRSDQRLTACHALSHQWMTSLITNDHDRVNVVSLAPCA